MTITSFEEWLQQVDADSEDISVDRDELYKVVKEGFDAFDGEHRADLLWRMGRAAFKVSNCVTCETSVTCMRHVCFCDD